MGMDSTVSYEARKPNQDDQDDFFFPGGGEANIGEFETYGEAYRRLGSHALARKAMGAQAHALEERRVQTADGVQRRDWKRLEQRRYERRVATDGPFRVQNIIEKMQPNPNPLRKKFLLDKLSSAKDPEQRDYLDQSEIVKSALRAALSSKVISLQWKHFEEVPRELESTLTVQLNDVKTILLMGNRFRKLPTWSRYSFRHLKELNVSNNLLEELPPNLGDFKTLETIVCKQNTLTSLPASICKLSHLRVLDVRGNHLACLPKGIGKLRKLETLLLGQNHIELFPWSFKELCSLTTLEVGRNELRALAFIELLQIRDDSYDAEDFDMIWEIRSLPNGATVYYNRNTKEVLQRPPKPIERGDPWSELVPGDPQYDETWGSLAAVPETTGPYEDRVEQDLSQVPALQLDQIPGSDSAAKKKGNENLRKQKVMLRRKAVLARQDKGLWSCELDLDSGHQVFMNNLYRVSQVSMPNDLDHFGRLRLLKRLVLSRNKLTEIPPSVGNLHQLSYLDLSTNKLTEIAPCIMALSELTYLDMSDNSIGSIPGDISKLVNLTVLLLQRNVITQVPAELGSLVQLEKLWLMDNSLIPGSLPSSLRALRSLQDIQLGENPVLDDEKAAFGLDKESIATIAKRSLAEGRVHRQEVLPKPMFQQGGKTVAGRPPEGRPHRFPALMWHFEEQNRLETFGQPPRPHKMYFGISQELQDSNFRYSKEEKEHILAAKATGCLTLHWKGLKEVPQLVYRLSNCLIELRLVGNELPELSEDIGVLKNLRVLDARSNSLTAISERVGGLRELKELILADNALTFIPEPIGELSKLQKLVIQGNKIVKLPETFAGLKSLKILEANVNHLSDLPEGLASLQMLEVLLLNNNRLETFPPQILKLKSLRVLQLNLNKINALPNSLSGLETLQTLHLASNKLTFFQNALAHGPLTNSLKSLWLTANQIPELCDDFHYFEALEDLRLDLNQMISPPEDFALREGVKSVLQYCKIRSSRLKKIVLQLEEANFGVVAANLRPNVKEALNSNTGFLTSEMLAEIDRQLDRYLNGPIFDHPGLSGRKIVQDAFKQRAHQRHLFLDAVLRQFLIVMELLEADPEICTRHYFNPNIKRRWGRNKTLLDCYAIRLEALFSDQTNPEQRAIVEKLEERTEADRGGLVYFREIQFQGEKFLLHRPVLEDALNSFSDPCHGEVTTSAAPVRFKPYRDYSHEASSLLPLRMSKVSRDATRSFSKGGGEDTQDDIYHDDYKVVKRPFMAAVIPKLIYTNEEAQRLQYERSLLTRELELAREGLETWFQSDDFKARLKKELKRRVQNMKRRIANAEVDVQYALQGVQEAKRDNIDVKSRMKYFEKGAPYHEHGFKTSEEAENTVAEAQKALDDATKQVEDAKQHFKSLKGQVKEKPKQQEERAKSDLMKKVLSRRRRYIIFQGRMMARKRSLRRPWDGNNGEVYLKWTQYLDAIERDIADIEEEAATNNKRYQLDPDVAAIQAENLRVAMEGVEARKELIYHIREVHDHAFGWSSDDSDGVSDSHDFEMPVVDSDGEEVDVESKHSGLSNMLNRSISKSSKSIKSLKSLGTSLSMSQSRSRSRSQEYFDEENEADGDGDDDAASVTSSAKGKGINRFVLLSTLQAEKEPASPKPEIDFRKSSSQQTAQVAMSALRLRWKNQREPLNGEDDGELQLSSLSEDSVGDSLSSMSDDEGDSTGSKPNKRVTSRKKKKEGASAKLKKAKNVKGEDEDSDQEMLSDGGSFVSGSDGENNFDDEDASSDLSGSFMLGDSNDNA